MHITIVTACMQGGGAERVISRLLDDFVGRGIKCSLILIYKKQIDYKIPESVALFEIGDAGGNALTRKIRAYKRVRTLVKQLSPDIVLSLPEEIGIYVNLALLGTKFPVVVSERNNPWVMPYKKVTRALRRISYPFASGLIFQTKMASSFFPKSQQKKGIVLPNPLDCENLPPPYLSEREKLIIGAGRLNVQKNFPLLINAFAEFYKKHPDYRLIIYGEGEEREKLTQLAKVLPEGAITLPGRVNDLAERMKRAKMFVLSSDFEGMPNVLIEAMALGLPCISTDCPSGGSAELIENNKNGILVSVGDKNALVNAMCTLAEDTSLCESFSKEAPKVREALDCSKVCGNWLNYLEKIINK